jgi:curli production assembly/transport component CsgE
MSQHQAGWTWRHTGLCIAVLALLCSPVVQGQDLAGKQNPLPEPKLETDKEKDVRKIFEDPLAGIVVNRTVTVQGNEFYQYFAQAWRQRELSNAVTIVVRERPTARYGSEIWVLYRNQAMLHAFLPPARAATRKISTRAVEIVNQNITNKLMAQLLNRSPDLGPEEL